MPTHTATIRTIHRDPAACLIILTLDDVNHSTTFQAIITYCQAAPLSF